MNPNNNPLNTQNSTNYLFNYPNPNYIFQNQSSNQQGPQNISNFIMSSSNPNYRPYYRSMMSYSSQAPHYYSSTPMGNENVPNVGLDEFLDFSTQTALGGISGGHGVTPNAEDSTHTMLLGETKKVIHIGVKLLITVMSIAHLILPVTELHVEIITTT
ncbi:unnamed protein product [Vicia faba]|uniref:Uncharacterized protein n=1 Tax=Vicia faba TaxID=3906 RepID=A0AAV0ZXK0_VICFA|nr:unnamed protein product [Vicia faba]